MNRRLAVLSFCLAMTVCLSAYVVSATQNSASNAVRTVVRLDAALDSIISANAKLEALKSDYFGFSEGPLWVRQGTSGYLLFSDIAANSIYKWTPGDTLSVFMAKAGFTGTDSSQVGAQADNGRLNVILMGSNALTLDPQGRLLLVAMGDRTIVRIERDGKRTTLADRYEGKRINGGNDIVSKSDGAIYFTDGTGGLRGRDSSPQKELPYNGVFLIKNGTLTFLTKDPQGGTPNGIAFSPDEKYLYVNGGNRFITRHEVQPDGTLANDKLFFELKSDLPGNTDGMKVDSKGNVFCTGPGGIWIISPDGKHLGTILVPEPGPTNVAFGDNDAKSLFITNRRSLYRIRLNTAGIVPGPR